MSEAERSPPPKKILGPPVELSDVRVKVPGRVLLDDIHLSLAPGEVVALLGPNGAGKTTLVRTALGLIRPQQGEVTLGGRSLEGMSPTKRAGFLGWLPQHNEVSEPLDSWEVVAAARYRFREPVEAGREAAYRALARVGALDLAARRFSVLSGGERQRVIWASLLAQDVPLFMLDEPASHLDPAQQCEAYRRIGELWRDGHGILCVTHDVNLLAFVGPASDIRIVGIDQGRVALRTHFDDPQLADKLSALFHTPFTVFEKDGRRLFYPRLEGLS